MPLKDIGRNMWHDYFTIVTGVLFCVILFNDKNIEIRVVNLWYILLSGVLYSLPYIVFYSRRELNKAQWLKRKVLHFILLECTVVGSAYLIFDWLEADGIIPGLPILILMVLAVYLIVVFTEWQRDRQSADKINQKLQELNREEPEC